MCTDVALRCLRYVDWMKLYAFVDDVNDVKRHTLNPFLLSNYFEIKMITATIVGTRKKLLFSGVEKSGGLHRRSSPSPKI